MCAPLGLEYFYACGSDDVSLSKSVNARFVSAHKKKRCSYQNVLIKEITDFSCSSKFNSSAQHWRYAYGSTLSRDSVGARTLQ